MKWMTIGALAAAMAMLAVSGFAQSDADYQGYMKAIGGANGSLGKNLAAKSADAAADAKKIQDTLKMVEAFWKAKGVDDAVGFAQKGQSIAGMVAADVAAGDFDKAIADQKTFGTACGACHMAHREGKAPDFKIKQ
jgi:cytochrome c556